MPNITFTEGSGLQDSIFGKSQAPIRLFIEKRGEAHEQESMIPKLFNMGKSKNWGEKFSTMTAMDGFSPVGENGEYPQSETSVGYEKFLEHMTWKNAFSLSREIVEDAKLIDLKKKPQSFINSFYRTREKFAAALYGAALAGKTSFDFGGKTFNAASADSKALFDNEHAAKITGSLQSNKFSDVFSVDALAALECAMQNFKGDNDELLDIAPDTIVIPNLYTLKKEVFSAIGADQDPATANNGYNYQFGLWNVVVWPYLNQYVTEGSTPWILLDSRYNEDNGGAVWLDRTPLEVRSTVDNTNDANTWRGYARFIAGFNDWRFAAVGGITGGTSLISA